MNLFAKRLKELLNEKRGDKHYGDVAKEFGLSISQTRDLVAGIVLPNDKLVKCIAQKLEVPSEDLIALVQKSKPIPRRSLTCPQDNTNPLSLFVLLQDSWRKP